VALGTAVIASFLLLVKKMATHDLTGSPQSLHLNVCPKPCLDVVIPYHEADESMFVHNGGLVAAKAQIEGRAKHLCGICFQ